MKKSAIFLAIVVSIQLLAQEPAQAPSKEEMRKKLDDYVQTNQEASATIAPLIERLRHILGAKDVNSNRKPASKDQSQN